MDIEHEHKFIAMVRLWRTLTPTGLTRHKLVWQMNTEMVMALLKEAVVLGGSDTIRVLDGVLPSNSIECLGIPVEIITKDEVNLVIKVA